MADTTHHHDHHAHVSAHNPGAGRGSVVLDIGGDVGALVLHTRDDMVGREIEISPVGRDQERSHVEVLPRRTPSGSVQPTAVYGALRDGGWTLWDSDGAPAMVVVVRGGEVAEATWPTSAS